MPFLFEKPRNDQSIYSDLEKYDRLLSDEADLQSLIDITQELFPVELLGKVVISVAEVCFIYQ